MAYVRLTCTGTSFSPWLQLVSGSTASVTWTIEGGSLAAPAAPTLTTAATGGTVADGVYQVEITYTDGNGETIASASASITASSGGANTNTLTITSPVASGAATGWYAYVTQAGGSTYTRQQAAGSATAIGTDLVLTASPTSTGAAPPTSNTTGQATGLQPTITLPGGTSYIDLTATASGVDALDQISMFNVGYDDAIDTGNYNIGPSYNWPTQQLTGIQYLNLMTGLQIFAADKTPLGGALDFSNMSALTHIEVYQSNVMGVTLTGCTSLQRLQVEQCQLTTLDMNPISSSLYDLRSAAQQGGTLTFATLTSPMAKEYHFCVRDQIVINPPTGAQLPVVQQQWIWDTDQSGAFVPTSSALTDLEAYNNFFTSADLSSLTGGSVQLQQNNISSVTLGANPLNLIDLRYNCLDTPQIDNILAVVDGWGTTGGTINLQGNRPPSPAGQAYVTSLQGKSWATNVETLTSAARPAGVAADGFNRADATGVAAVGNGWFTPGSANANISSNMLVRTDSGSYQQFLNMGGGLLPADYTVVVRFPGSNMNSNNYFGLIGRFTENTTNGAQAFFGGGWAAADLVICNSRGFESRKAAITTLANFPPSWANTSIDHTMAMRMSGTIITVILDGVAVAQATVPDNATVWGTGYGICGEGDNCAYYSIGTAAAENATTPATIL